MRTIKMLCAFARSPINLSKRNKVKNVITLILLALCCTPSFASDYIGDWKVISGMRDGHLTIYRYRVNLLGKVNPKNFPTMVAIKWKYDEKNEHGSPAGETNKKQLKFEELLDPLDVTGVSYLTEIVTRNGTKEWIWYVSDYDKWMKKLNSALKYQSVYPVEINYYSEPSWETYTGFITWISEVAHNK